MDRRYALSQGIYRTKHQPPIGEWQKRFREHVRQQTRRQRHQLTMMARSNPSTMEVAMTEWTKESFHLFMNEKLQTFAKEEGIREFSEQDLEYLLALEEEIYEEEVEAVFRMYEEQEAWERARDEAQLELFQDEL
eukprot:TRINITY_DN2632_c0_g2_i2.p1 TRINITY_DN2632_c0_g2~~TRINITY_DN2632_c0_g2_i2.p1  ORF type:complete len:135 (+),score=24.44 TRINITY_DN2632_c0_g2_i2:83-487(+)